MQISRSALSLVKLLKGLTSSDESLRQVRIESDGSAVASNGAVLVAVEPLIGPGLPVKIEGEIALEGTASDSGVDSAGVSASVACDGFGAKPETVLEVLRTLPKGSGSEELSFAALTYLNLKKKRLEFTTTDLKDVRKLRSSMARREFPEWKGALRRVTKAVRVEGARVCIGLKALKSLVDSLGALVGGSDAELYVEVSPEWGMVVRSFNALTKQRILAYVTAIDTGGKWLPLSEWERGVCGRKVKRRKKHE